MSDLELKTALSEMHEKIDAQIKSVSEKADGTDAEYKAAVKELDTSIKSLNDEIAELAQKFGTTQEVIEAKTFGQQVMESDGVKSFLDGTSSRARVEVKNTILNSGNASSTHDQLAGVVPGAFRQLTVMPTVMQGSAASNTIFYSKESNWVNGAASQVEGNAKAEATLTFEEVSEPVRTIAHFIKVSKQALDDSTFLSSYIERRLRHGINNKVEDQVINGDGTGVNLSGWLATGNNTVISPLLTVDFFGLANKLKMSVIANDYEPSYFYANPADWGAAETARRASGDNAFVAASGAVAYVNNGLTPMLWGLPVVLSNNVPAGTLICKSAEADMYASREGTVVEMFEQDSDNVTKNLVTVRAETRGAELVFTAAAICTGDITGITSPV
jgi:HK97 family phage major capsid protein